LSRAPAHAAPTTPTWARPRIPDGTFTLDIEAQTEALIENIRGILQAAGLDLEHLVDVTTFLVEMKDFPGYNRVYNRFFDAQTGPTRTTVARPSAPAPQPAHRDQGRGGVPARSLSKINHLERQTAACRWPLYIGTGADHERAPGRHRASRRHPAEGPAERVSLPAFCR
jgi:enamine deaminase RidA (YjgF/YER057c/UK114 family)